MHLKSIFDFANNLKHEVHLKSSESGQMAFFLLFTCSNLSLDINLHSGLLFLYDGPCLIYLIEL